MVNDLVASAFPTPVLPGSGLPLDVVEGGVGSFLSVMASPLKTIAAGAIPPPNVRLLLGVAVARLWHALYRGSARAPNSFANRDELAGTGVAAARSSLASICHFLMALSPSLPN